MNTYSNPFMMTTKCRVFAKALGHLKTKREDDDPQA